MKKLIKSFFRWVFKTEINALELSVIKSVIEIQNAQKAIYNCKATEKRFSDIVGSIDASVDVHNTGSPSERRSYYSPSWAVVSIQGEKEDFIKFFDLGRNEIREIQLFLRQFDKIKVDAPPTLGHFLKFDRKEPF